MSSTHDTLREYAGKIDQLGRSLGLDYYAVNYEVAPANLMLEISVYGLPIRMPHWSFGVRYIHQLIRQNMGNSKIFEVMFPGDPVLAYLMDTNSLAENTLVTAHVFGHADFSKNNQLFARFHKMMGGRIVDQAAAHAHRIGAAIEEHGKEKVELALDAALALEAHIGLEGEVYRDPYPERIAEVKAVPQDPFRDRFAQLPGVSARPGVKPAARAPIPPHPEDDLLWFLAKYAPEMEQWERDIFLAVREESFYFYPVFACQIMNEGWASYWHARLLREADWLPGDLYLQAIKAHSDVVRPYAGEEQVALGVNPYHLGFCIWEDVIEKHGMEKARTIMAEEDDFGFIRNWLDKELAEKLNLFVYSAARDGEIKVKSSEINAVRESILAPKFNYGAPRITVTELRNDGGLELQHNHESDGRGLDLPRATKVLDYIHRMWRRPVRMSTLDAAGKPCVLTAGS